MLLLDNRFGPRDTSVERAADGAAQATLALVRSRRQLVRHR